MTQYSTSGKGITMNTRSKNKTCSGKQRNKGYFFKKISFTLLTEGTLFGGGNPKVEAQTIIKNDSIKPYINFLERDRSLSSREYIFSKFETHDIVILSERFHQEMTQYDMIMEVVKDERFKGHIYTEIGHVNLYEKFNNFLMNATLTEEEKEKELLSIYRDLCPSLVWGAYNYYHMLNEVWALNKDRNKEDKILIFPTDVPFDYNEIQTHREWDIHYNLFFNSIFRDQIMAMNFVDYYEEVKKEKRKALVILNSMHAYKRNPTYLSLPTRPLIRRAGEFIYKTYPEETFVIYINSCNIDNFKLSNHGIIDAAFEYTKKDDIGFDLKDTTIGNTKFDLYFTYAADYFDLNINYDYLFDGMIYYKPLKEMVIKMGIPDIYSKEYEDMYYRRAALMSNKKFEEAKNGEEYRKALEQINNPAIIPLDDYFGDGVVESWDKQIQKWIE